jgi:hypothetical protein
MARFPGPYLNECNENDPIMKRIANFDNSDIGARTSAMPKGGVNSSDMAIKHTGGALGKGE